MKYLVYWSNRRTAQVVDAKSASEARRKGTAKKKKNYGTITSARKATPQETKTANSGKWVQTKTKASSKRRGLGPKPKK